MTPLMLERLQTRFNIAKQPWADMPLFPLISNFLSSLFLAKALSKVMAASSPRELQLRNKYSSLDSRVSSSFESQVHPCSPSPLSFNQNIFIFLHYELTQVDVLKAISSIKIESCQGVF